MLDRITGRTKGDPLWDERRGLIEQILENPFTFDQQYIDQLNDQAAGQTALGVQQRLNQVANIADRAGVGRRYSAADQIRLAGLTNRMNAAQGIQQMAAQQRIPDILRASGALQNFLTSEFAPEREASLARLGSLSGLAGLSAAQAQNAQNAGGALDVLGTLGGSFLGNAGLFATGGLLGPAQAAGACWIAEAVYGVHDSRTTMARHYVNTSPHPFMSVVRFVYRLVGKPVAAVVRRSRLLRGLFKPVFDIAVRKGLRSLSYQR